MKKFKFLFLLVLSIFLACQKTENAIPKSENIEKSKDVQALKLSKIKDSIKPFFKPMVVKEGDWLKSFSENGQTFDEYLKANPTLPTSERKTIYIQPIGEFTKTQNKILQLTADYMKAFYNLPVKLNPVKNLGKLPKEFTRKNPYEGQQQIKTSYFLENLLPKMLPNDAAALICFTNIDLYPDDDWNYVFGIATFQNRVGVWSLWRFGNPDKSVEDYNLFLMRTLKIAMHEMGHTFTIQHCTKYECLMSGTISLEETDRHPIDICPEDMAKISWALKYPPNERFRNLADFWKTQNFDELHKEFLAKENAVNEAMKE